MPRVFDNITSSLLSALEKSLSISERADFCIGYFHLRGWGALADHVEKYEGGDASCCRVLVGMQRPPREAMKETQRAVQTETYLDNPTLARLKREAAESFKEQIEFGVPTNQAEAVLRKLAAQLRASKVRVRLFLRHPLHAKLYLLHRDDFHTPLVGYVGSSNLSWSGLQGQGELNVDVVEQDAVQKLHRWFEERWEDDYAFDVSEDLAALIESSWAREEVVAPYHVYLKVAYHLCEEARRGERQFKLPERFEGELLDHNKQAVTLAAYHLHRRGGVLLGDVVGLGKTFVALATAKVFQEDDGSNTLIICPPKLEEMWQAHVY